MALSIRPMQWANLPELDWKARPLDVAERKKMAFQQGSAYIFP
jgi:hypothetical protein